MLPAQSGIFDIKAIDRILSCLLILGGVGHRIGSFVAYRSKPDTLLWSLCTLLFIFLLGAFLLGAVNFGSAGRPGDRALMAVAEVQSLLARRQYSIRQNHPQPVRLPHPHLRGPNRCPLRHEHSHHDRRKTVNHPSANLSLPLSDPVGCSLQVPGSTHINSSLSFRTAKEAEKTAKLARTRSN